MEPSARPSCATVSTPPFSSAKLARFSQDRIGCDHFVQFYRTDDYLIECLASYLAEGLWNGEAVVVIATAAHRTAVQERLRVKGVNLDSTMLQSRYFSHDAEETMNRLLVGDRINRAMFYSEIGEIVTRAAGSGTSVRGFGEIVALLWKQGRRSAALELEELWNELCTRKPLRLFCAYPASAVDSPSEAWWMEQICRCHTQVLTLSA